MKGGGGEDNVDYMGEEAGKGSGGVWTEGTEGKMTPAPLWGHRGHGGVEGHFGAQTGTQGGDRVNTGEANPCWILCVRAEGKE